MKSSIYTITILLVLLVSCTGRAQMVKTVDEIDKLDSNKSYFIGKDFKHLLSEIKPEIKMVKFIPGVPGRKPSSIILFFIPVNKYDQYQREHIQEPSYVRVIVNKNDFEYNWKGLKWTQEMVKKYSSYIVQYIIVFKGGK